MEQAGTETFDMKKMVADYMEKGCLDNIIDMYKHDESLYEYVADLLKDERMRVRIGIIALIEALQKEEPEKVKKVLSSILPLLKDENAVVRGDAAYLLGIIGDKDAIPFLEEIAKDEDADVRLIVKEAIDDIRRTFNPVNASR
jgi:HEAT repeat protein